MREVSVRMLHFSLDLAHAGELDEAQLLEGLPSVTGVGGEEPDWIDWDDLVEIVERLERMLGGPEGMARVMRSAATMAWPEIRGFAGVFVRPIPLFKFVLTRLFSAMYRHIEIEDLVLLDGDKVRWQLTIPDHYRGSEAFHRSAIPFVEAFPRILELPEARIVEKEISPRRALYVAQFPSEPLAVRGSRAVSVAASGLARQLDDVFAKVAASLRAKPPGDSDAPPQSSGSAPPQGWAERLALSPRQRDVFALLVEGRANKDIAAALQCSERNVEFHVGRILRAAHVSSRAELLVKVLGTRS